MNAFLVNYREVYDIDYSFERYVFVNDCSDNGLIAEVVGNDGIRPRMGSRSSIEETSHLQGLRMMDNLRQAIYEHGIVRPYT